MEYSEKNLPFHKIKRKEIFIPFFINIEIHMRFNVTWSTLTLSLKCISILKLNDEIEESTLIHQSRAILLCQDTIYAYLRFRGETFIKIRSVTLEHNWLLVNDIYLTCHR